MAERGRKAGFKMGAEHRTKIANSKILKHLIEHVEGTRPMEGTQVTAGIALLKKVMPDLSHSDVTSGGEPVTFDTIILAPLVGDDEADQTTH